MPQSSTTNLRSYAAVADSIRESLLDGTLRPGALLPTERELQASFGVSRSTVRRALHQLIDSGWADQIANRGVVGKIGQSRTPSKVVGFIDYADSLHQGVFFRLSLELERLGYHLTLVDSHHRTDEGALELCLDRGFDAAILWSKTATPNVDRIERVRARMPIVAINHSLPNMPLDNVRNDTYTVSAAVVAHLRRLGRRRIAFTGMLDGLDFTLNQFSGFVAGHFAPTLSERVAPEARNFLPSRTSGRASDDFSLLESRLEESDRPDAIMAFQEATVPPLADLLERKGFRIPEDIAIVSFGNELPFRFGSAQLTTVGFDWDAVCAHVAERVADRAANPYGVPQSILVPAHLIVRGSCGAPAGEWSTAPLVPSRLSTSDTGSLTLANL